MESDVYHYLTHQLPHYDTVVFFAVSRMVIGYDTEHDAREDARECIRGSMALARIGFQPA